MRFLEVLHPKEVFQRRLKALGWDHLDATNALLKIRGKQSGATSRKNLRQHVVNVLEWTCDTRTSSLIAIVRALGGRVTVVFEFPKQEFELGGVSSGYKPRTPWGKTGPRKKSRNPDPEVIEPEVIEPTKS